MVESNSLWVINLGTTNHIVRDRGLFVQYQKIPAKTRLVYIEDNSRIEVDSTGTCKISMQNGHHLYLIDVLDIPYMRRNLISISCLLHFGYQLNFYDNVLDI